MGAGPPWAKVRSGIDSAAARAEATTRLFFIGGSSLWLRVIGAPCARSPGACVTPPGVPGLMRAAPSAVRPAGRDRLGCSRLLELPRGAGGGVKTVQNVGLGRPGPPPPAARRTLSVSGGVKGPDTRGRRRLEETMSETRQTRVVILG